MIIKKNINIFIQGKLLPIETGGPARVVIPDKYGYKRAMWLTKMQVTEKQKSGCLEKREYSSSADPSEEERREPSEKNNSGANSGGQ